MTEKITRALRLIDLFADLPANCLTRFERFCTIRKISAQETIFCQGEPSPYCFGILSGQVTIQRVPKKKEFLAKTLSVLGPGALFGEQALFKDTPRTAMARASQTGELVAIQGKAFRDWLEKEPRVGMPLLMGILQNTLSRLRQTSQELSLVYGVGRELESNKPIRENIQHTCDFLRASLENVDEVILYQRNPYWDEFEPLAAPEAEAAVLPQENSLVLQLSHTLAPYVSKEADEIGKNAAVALIPCIDPDDSKTPLIGFLWVGSHKDREAFSPNKLSLLAAVSTQLTEALLRLHRLEDLQAKSRLSQKY